ncbi:MAG: hypothetical protein Q7R62_02750 [bacterium]|nr:hypothetical protein [bacterium]
MSEIKKIAILKSDEPAEVAEKLMDSEAEEIILSIPKFSKFGESISNFKLIKRQAELLKCTVRIESVDEDVVALAKKAGLEASNPFFGRAARSPKQFSDIIVKKPSRIVAARAAPIPKPEPKPAPEAAPLPVSEPIVSKPAPEIVATPIRITGLASVSEISTGRRFFNKIFKGRISLFVIVAIVVFGLVPYIAFAVLPRAEIKLTMQKEDWTFKNAVVADKSIVTIDKEASRIPGQVFLQKTNVSSKFPATGKKNIERKATGIITIYNAYSSAAQSLIANTRFVTPDGKVFRLVSAVTVPGAKIASGKVVPSSVTAEVIADKPGSAYNIGPIAKLTIPGFSGTPKYEGFYGDSKAAFTGGFIGEAKVATEEDIKNAKVKSTANLESSLRTLMTTQMPADFTVLDDATIFTLTKQTVTPEAGIDGQFTVLSEGQVSLIAFREKDLLDFLHGRIDKEKGGEFEILGENKEYGISRVDMSAGRVSFALIYTAKLRHKLDQTKLISQIVGKSEEEIKTVIGVVPGIAGGTANLWPFYVRTVTKNTDKIKIAIE